MSEKLTEAQNAQAEVLIFQALVDRLTGQVSSEVYRINTTHDPLIQNANNALDTAIINETQTYSDYIVLENEMNDLIFQRQYFIDLMNSHLWNLIAVAMDLVNISTIEGKMSEIVPSKSSAWLTYLDAVSNKNNAESNYNSALLAKSNDSAYLNQLKAEKIAATDSLNMWKIAYQAATNVYNDLVAQLAALQGV